jgi:hypothetical protein
MHKTGWNQMAAPRYQSPKYAKFYGIMPDWSLTIYGNCHWLISVVAHDNKISRLKKNLCSADKTPKKGF